MANPPKIAYALSLTIKFDGRDSENTVVVNLGVIWKALVTRGGQQPRNARDIDFPPGLLPDTFPKKAFQQLLILCVPPDTGGSLSDKLNFNEKECEPINTALNGGNAYAAAIKDKIIKPALEYLQLTGSIKKDQNINNYKIIQVLKKKKADLPLRDTSAQWVADLEKYQVDNGLPQVVQDWYNIFCNPTPIPTDPTDPTPPGKPTDPVTPQQPVIAPPAKTEKIKLATINYVNPCGKGNKLEIFSEETHDLRFLIDINELKVKISDRLKTNENLYDSIWQDKPNNILNFKKFFEKELSNSLRAGNLEVPEDKKPVFATKKTYKFPENTETDQNDLRLFTGRAQGECELTILPNRDRIRDGEKKNPYKYIKLQYNHFRNKVNRSAFSAGMQLLTDDEEPAPISVGGYDYILQPSFYTVQFNDSFIVNVPVKFNLDISPKLTAANNTNPPVLFMELECTNIKKPTEPCFPAGRPPAPQRIDTDFDLTSDISSTPITVTTFIQVKYKLNPDKKKGLGIVGDTTKNNITTPGSEILALCIRLKNNLNLEDPAILNKFRALVNYLVVVKKQYSYVQNEDGSQMGFMFNNPAISKKDLQAELDKDTELPKYQDIIQIPYITGSSICYIVDGKSYMDQEAEYVYDNDFTKPDAQIKANLEDTSKFTISLEGILSGGQTNRDPTIYFKEILSEKTKETIKKALEKEYTAADKKRHGVDDCCSCCWVLKDIENKNIKYGLTVKARE